METSPPDISVVVPLYNKERFIHNTLASVKAQTLQPNRIIVVDDGSTDDGPQIVRERFPEVELLPQSNSGVGAARNHGLSIATTRFVAFLDADDLWLPTHLEALARSAALFPTAVAHGTNHWKMDATATIRAMPEHRTQPADPRVKLCLLSSAEFLVRRARRREVLWTSATMVRREVALQVGGFTTHRTGEDAHLWLRMALRGPIARSTEITAVYVRGTGGLTDGATPMGSRIILDQRKGTARIRSAEIDAVMQALAEPQGRRIRTKLLMVMQRRLTRCWLQVLLLREQEAARCTYNLIARPWHPEAMVYRLVASLPSTIAAVLASAGRWFWYSTGKPEPRPPFSFE